MKGLKRTSLIVAGTSIATTYICIHYLFDAGLQGEIHHLCDINGGFTNRTLDSRTFGNGTTLAFTIRSPLDGNLDDYSTRLKTSELGYYWLNLKLAQVLHREHFIDLAIDSRQHNDLRRPGKLNCRVIFYVSAAQYRQ